MFIMGNFIYYKGNRTMSEKNKIKYLNNDEKQAVQFADKLFAKYKNAYPELDENILRAKLSKKIISRYANKAGTSAVLICLTSLIPAVGTYFSSIGGAFTEGIFVFRKQNKNLMISLARINNYECDNDEYKEIESSSFVFLASIGLIINFFLRLADLIPVYGQIFVLVIGMPLCFFINKFIVSKFGELVLKEFTLNLE